jgi:hypothetical protein
MKILNYRRQPQGSYALALFDVHIPAIDCTWHNLKLVQNKKGGKYIQSPQFKDGEVDGKAIYKPYFSFGDHKGREFNSKCLELLREFDSGPNPHTMSDSLFN